MLAQSDATTTFAGALAAFYERITVGHLEAGLHTGTGSLLPEEINRRPTSVPAGLQFAPTPAPRHNLLHGGIAADTILVFGAPLSSTPAGGSRHTAALPVARELDGKLGFLSGRKRQRVVTGHRRERFGGGMESICHPLAELAPRSDVQIVYPVLRASPALTIERHGAR